MRLSDELWQDCYPAVDINFTGTTRTRDDSCCKERLDEKIRADRAIAGDIVIVRRGHCNMIPTYTEPQAESRNDTTVWCGSGSVSNSLPKGTRRRCTHHTLGKTLPLENAVLSRDGLTTFRQVYAASLRRFGNAVMGNWSFYGILHACGLSGKATTFFMACRCLSLRDIAETKAG